MSQDEEVKEARQLIQEVVSAEGIETQEELTQVYESLVEDFSHLQKTKYLTRLPNFTREQLEQIVRNFLEKPIHAKFLQKKNILLSAELWRKIMLAPKKKILDDYIVEIEDETRVVRLSQLSYAKINGRPKFLLRNIEIKLPAQTLANDRRLIAQISLNLSKIITTGKLENIDKLEHFVNGCVQFGIHDYLLPEGYLDNESLENAVLLFRYERVFQRENETNINTDGHGNYGLPQFYQKVYPLTISQDELTSESHLHFSEGVCAMSKLEDRSARRNRNNLGAGYALPISNLKEYLIKIYKRKFESLEEEDFYLNNDFGMHFLYLRGDVMEKVLEQIATIESAGRPFDEMKMALRLMDTIRCEKTHTKQKTQRKALKKENKRVKE